MLEATTAFSFPHRCFAVRVLDTGVVGVGSAAVLGAGEETPSEPAEEWFVMWWAFMMVEERRR